MAEDVLAAAAGELGNRESPINSNRTRYGEWFGLNGKPWCMIFVQWCFNQAGRTLPYKTASCSGLLSWYRKYQPERIVTTPQPRDIAIYKFGHTGIIESAAPATITAIEGNTSAGEAGSQSNGGGVFRRTRNRALVAAYIRPFDNPDQEEDDMVYYRTLADVPKGYQDTVRRLMEKGALKGYSDPDPGRLDDNVLNISEDMCRTLAVLDSLGKLD